MNTHRISPRGTGESHYIRLGFSVALAAPPGREFPGEEPFSRAVRRTRAKATIGRPDRRSKGHLRRSKRVRSFASTRDSAVPIGPSLPFFSLSFLCVGGSNRSIRTAADLARTSQDECVINNHDPSIGRSNDDDVARRMK